MYLNALFTEFFPLIQVHAIIKYKLVEANLHM